MSGKAYLSTLVVLLLFVNIDMMSQVSDSLFTVSCQNEDLIILSEDMEVSIIGKKLYFMHAEVSNKLTIVINSTGGIDKVQPVTLPRKFDELYMYHAPAIRNIDWEYQNIKVKEFTASLVENSNLKSELKVTPKVNEKRVLNEEGFFGNANIYKYYIDGVKKGDTIQISYSYDIDFNGNWFKLLSNRMFFNGVYPKKSFNLKWCFDLDLVVDSLFVNHDPPDIIVENKQRCYNWSFKNLTGCIDEPESRPYLDLPYFLFVPKPYDLEYTHFDSYKQEFIPIYYIGASKRQMELSTEKNDNIIGNKNKNNQSYWKVAKHILKQAPNDTSGIVAMRCFQRYMVDSTEYDPAINYYKHLEDHLRQRAGVDLYGHIVSDHNVDRIYGNMIYKLGLNYLTAYPVDNRVGEISSMYNSTVKDNDMMFAVILKDQTVGLVLPKTDKNNYYFEELPFYYEDIPVLLIDIADYLNRSQHGGKRNYNTKFRTYITPKNNWKDNYRKIQGKAIVNLADNTAKFQTRVSLSGQYSTLTRFVYNDNAIDSTINPRYTDPIWQIGENVEVIKAKQDQPEDYYPFKTKINTEYNVSGLIETDGKIQSMNIGEWFKLVYSDGVIGHERFLDYFPDFIGSDSYTYMLEFDQPIEIVSMQDTITSTNKYAHISLITKKIDAQHILLRCNYNILINKIDKEEIDLVKEINKHIEAIKESEIRFKIAE